MLLIKQAIGAISIIILLCDVVYAGAQNPKSCQWIKTFDGKRDCYSYCDSTKGISIIIEDASLPSPRLFSLKGFDNSSMRIILPSDFGLAHQEATPVLYPSFEPPMISADTIIAEFDGGNYRWYWRSPLEFEWEIILESIPEYSSFNFPIDVSNLVLFYQPPLTEYEVIRGAQRPDSVVGSYAAYSISDSDGLQISDKVFHIYRPKAFDALGNYTWCDLEISRGILAINVPADFLQNAVYPVTVDPTVGYTTAGASSQVIRTNSKSSSRYILTESAIADSFFAYVRASFNPYPNISAAIYKGKTLNALLADSSAARNVSNTSASWQGFSLVNKSLVCQDTIWLALQCSSSDMNLYLYYDSGTAGADSSQTAITDALPLDDRLGVGTGGNRKYSIYMNYQSGNCAGGIRRRKILTGDFND